MRDQQPAGFLGRDTDTHIITEDALFFLQR